MLESIYLMYMAFALITAGISLSMVSGGRFNPVLTLLSAIICAFLSITSGSVDMIHCPENATAATDCFTYTYTNAPLVWFWGGMFVVLLLLAIYYLMDDNFKLLLKTMN